MIVTLGTAITELGRYVEAGITGRAPIAARINEAVERLIVKADWKDTVRWIRVNTSRKTIPLPREFEVLTKVSIDGAPVSLWGPGYEFLQGGPGDLEVNGANIKTRDLINLGSYFPCMYDIPKVFVGTPASAQSGYTLIAFASNAADAGRTLTIRGLGSSSEELYTNGAPGEIVTINQWGNGTPGNILGSPINHAHTVNLYRDVTQVIKPVTTGYVWLYAIDLTTNEMFLLSAYHPDETIPQVRRYRLTFDLADGVETTVLALAKMKGIPAVRDTDVLRISSLPALKCMVMAIREENLGNLNNTLSYQSMAMSILNDQLGEERPASMPTMVDVDNTCRLSGMDF